MNEKQATQWITVIALNPLANIINLYSLCQDLLAFAKAMLPSNSNKCGFSLKRAILPAVNVTLL